MQSKVRYVLRNFINGFLWLSVFVILFLLWHRYIHVDFFLKLEPVFDKTWLILFVFLASEIIIGIIPPELFIIWSLRNNQMDRFLILVGILAMISFLAGITGYFIGHYLNRSVFYRLIKRKFLVNLDRQLKDFGMYLILIAALTPLPFSGVSMLVGSVKYPFRKYLLLALSRFLRFALYAFVFWQVNPKG